MAMPQRSPPGGEEEIKRGEGQQEPAFVARQRAEAEPRCLRPPPRPSPAYRESARVKYSSAIRQREEDARFGHGDGLQIEQVGIEQRRRRRPRRPRALEPKMRRTEAKRNAPATHEAEAPTAKEPASPVRHS